MKARSLKLEKCNIIGAIFGIIIGSLWHFVYNWAGQNPLIAGIFPINESIWEHTKLLFFPMLIWYVAEYFIVGKTYENYIIARFIGIVSSIAVMISGFYTYSGIIGKDILWMDIALFVVSVLVCQWISYKLIRAENFSSKGKNIVFICFTFVLILAFIFWSYYPPQIPLFTKIGV